MKKTLQYITGSIIALAMFIFTGSIHAATLDFDPNSSAVKPEGTFEVTVNIDAGSQQVAGADVYIIYDSNYLEVQPVTYGDYFPQTNSNPTIGRLYITGVIASQGDYKTGAGTLATVKFKAKQEGTTELTFECDTSKGDTSKIIQNDVAVTNLLDCSTLVAHPVTISGTADGSSSSGATELPQSGIVEDMAQYAAWGGVLIALGAVLRILLRIV